MGMLDEAIREHLELKRRRGADPGEVARLEREALGPVEYESESQAASEPDAAHAVDPGHHGHDDPHAEASHQSLFVRSDGAHIEQHEAQAWQPPDDAPSPGTAAGQRGERPIADVDQPTQRFDPISLDDDEPSSVADEQPLAEESVIEQAPVAEQALAAEEHADEAPEETEGLAAGEDPDDLLEETPEFLQETPEHDRLWFEQKPPRDFDF